MKFEPHAFLRLAAASGITLKRHRERYEIMVWATHGLPDVWIDAIRKHKPALMRVLPVAEPPRRRRERQRGLAAAWKQQDAFDP